MATNDRDAVTTTALELLREYGPARPVRLLGVRVAALDHRGDEANAAQLSLDV